MSGRPAGVTDRAVALWLAVAAVTLRAVLPLLVPGAEYDGLFAPLQPDDLAYRTALREHPVDYLLYNHVLPVLFTGKNALLHNLLPADWIRPAGYGALVAADAVATAVAFLLMRQLAVTRPWALLVAVAVSLRLIVWEVRDWGAGWDAFNPALVLLFAWTVARFLRDRSTGTAWVAGLCGGLLIAVFQFGLPVVVAMAGGAIILLVPRPGLIRLGFCLLAIPGAVTAGIVGKNAAQHGLWSLSSGAGENIFLNLNMALEDDEGRGALKFGIRHGYPDWWAWCYDEAERRGVHPVRNVAGFYGACMMTPGGGTDFTALQDWLAAHPDPALAAIVADDVDIARNRPWLWDGPVKFRATGTSLAYGQVSQRLLGDILQEFPRNFAGRVYLNLTNHFLWETGHFLIDRDRATFNEPGLLRVLNRLAAPLFPVGFAAACVFFAAAAVVRVIAWIRPGPPAAHRDTLFALGALSAAVVAVAIVSAAMACCENHRHAFCMLPLAMCLGAAALQQGAAVVRRITLNRGFG